jgi:hypothetical protein
MTAYDRCRVCVAGLTLLAAATFLPALAGSFLDFDGSDDRVMVPYDPSFPTEVFTAAAWIRTLPPPGRGAIIARGEDDDSFNLVWQLYVLPDGTLQVMLEDASENNHCYPSTCMGQPQPGCTSEDLFVADDTWRHVAVTRDAAGELVIYVDGDERATCQSTGLPSSNNAQFLTIGCTHGTIGPPPGGEEPPVWFFPGEIDEPAMWNVALPQARVTEVYQRGVDPGNTGLVGYWNFDEGAGQVVADLSPARNHGFLGDNSMPSGDSADPQWVMLVGPGAVPDGSIVLGIPLTVGKNTTNPTDLDLSWGASCSGAVNDYAVYEGSLGSFDSHTAHTCTTGGAIDLALTPDGGDTYYLVVPLNDDTEGSYGTDAAGAERPRSTTACRALSVTDSCQ